MERTGNRNMENRILCIAVLFTIQFSGIFCRNSFYEYYYSKYHKGHSTTEAISSSTSGTPDEEGSRSSVSDYASVTRTTGASSTTTDVDSSLENVIYSSKVDHGVSLPTNVTVLQHGDPYGPSDLQYAFAVRSGIIIGCLVLFFLGSCCLFCCLRNRFRGSTRTGIIIGAAVHQQPVVIQQNQQPVVAQPQPPFPQYPPPYPDERTLLFPPQYQHEPEPQHHPLAQPHCQYSSTEQLQHHNPPEAPPPYEYPNKF